MLSELLFLIEFSAATNTKNQEETNDNSQEPNPQTSSLPIPVFSCILERQVT